MINYGNISLQVNQPSTNKFEDDQPDAEEEQDPEPTETFPNGRSKMQFDEFIDLIKESCEDKEVAENYLVHAFSMFDRKVSSQLHCRGKDTLVKMI